MVKEHLGNQLFWPGRVWQKDQWQSARDENGITTILVETKAMYNLHVSIKLKDIFIFIKL